MPNSAAAKPPSKPRARVLIAVAALIIVSLGCSSTSTTAVTAPEDPAADTTAAESDAQSPDTEAPEAESPDTEAPEADVSASPTPVPDSDNSDSETPEISDTDEEASDGDRVDPDALTIVGESINWIDCGLLTQCGALEVPVDPNDPELGTLELAVNVRRSSDPDSRIGYLLINPGGPGVSGVVVVENIDSIGFPPELLDAFDIVGFDPRGVGFSGPQFACGTATEQFDLLMGIDGYPDTDEEVEIGNSAAQLCVDSMGPVATRLGTQFVAQDMDAIRVALGADQISFLGFSYGSTIGGWYASMYPDRVRSMVIDGARNPLADADDLEQAIELARTEIGPIEEQFGAALESCADETCPIWNGGDPIGYWYETAPKMGLVADAESGSSDAIVLGVVGHLYSEEQWPDLHESIAKLNEFDDPSGFIAAIELATLGNDVNEPSFIAHVNCLDQWALFPEESLADLVAEESELSDQVDAVLEVEYPLLFAIDIPDQPGPCLYFESIDAPAFDGVYDGGDVPILVIGNMADPITPFVQTEEFANEVLTNGRLLRVEHPQHTVYPANNCVIEAVHAALIDLEFPSGDAFCSNEFPG